MRLEVIKGKPAVERLDVYVIDVVPGIYRINNVGFKRRENAITWN